MDINDYANDDNDLDTVIKDDLEDIIAGRTVCNISPEEAEQYQQIFKTIDDTLALARKSKA